ncbi:MAG: hydroxyacid dehydrogenase [Thiotrichales bacterium]|nr:hydroxyacid dehydrogenase [Thiotrichales bacterium]
MTELSGQKPSSETVDALVTELASIVGPKGWTTDPEVLAPRLEERRGLFHGATPIMVSPATTAEVSQVVRACAAANVPVVPQGGNTGLCGGAVPNESGSEVLLSLHRLNRIREIDPASNSMTVEAGCILADLQAAANEAGRLFPLSLAAEGSCQIGGNISTNAGGTAVLRYGNARELVLGLEVVLPDGQIWDGLRKLRKDNTGYDLKQIFIGSEGTLGIVTAAVLRLFPRPRSVVTAFVGMRDVDSALSLLNETRSCCGDSITGFELISRRCLEFCLQHIPGTRNPLEGEHAWYVLVELQSGIAGVGLRNSAEEAFATAFESDVIQDATIAENESQALAFWKIRESLPEAELHEGGSIKHDVSVPLPDIPAFIDQASEAVEKVLPGVRVVAFGHLGDGNIHFNVAQPEGDDKDAYLAKWGFVNEIVHGIVGSFDGSISAEHGLGRLKRDEVRHYKSPLEIDLMEKLKAAMDPDGMLNPGKVVR